MWMKVNLFKAMSGSIDSVDLKTDLIFLLNHNLM